MTRALLTFLAGVLLALCFWIGEAQARPTAHYLTAKTTLRVHNAVVLGHHVRICSWRPGDTRVRGLVRYSPATKTVPGWAQAGRKLSRAVCALNGGTYRTRTPNLYRPSGTVFAQGRKIRGVTESPAVGFVGGRVYMGAANARRHGARSVMNALAYLVRDGVPLRRHSEAPWTTPAQFNCGAPGTDGVYGCSRSVVAVMPGGRVAMLEIGHASMPLAARICKTLGIKAAATFDSGGAALMWTLQGTHNTSVRSQVGHLFGATVGTPWHRRIPDAIIINARRI